MCVCMYVCIMCVSVMCVCDSVHVCLYVFCVCESVCMYVCVHVCVCKSCVYGNVCMLWRSGTEDHVT